MLLPNRAPPSQAIQNADCCKSASTNPKDRRRILNYIAGEPEHTGCDLPLDEPSYEAKLFSSHEKEFKHFNNALRSQATKTIHDRVVQTRPQSAPTPSDQSPPRNGRIETSRRGLTLAQLREMAQTLKSISWTRGGEKIEWEKANIYDYEKRYMTKAQSYKEQVDLDKERIADWLISVPFATTLPALFRCIEWHAEARGLPDTTVYWSWFGSLTKKDIGDFFADQDGCTISECVMSDVDGMLWIADSVNCFSRLNPLHELHTNLMRETSYVVDLCCQTGVLACCQNSRPFAGKSYEFGVFDKKLAHAMLQFDIAKAKSHDATATQATLNAIARRDKKEPLPEQHEEWDKFNRLVRLLGVGPVLRECALNGDYDQAVDVLDTLGPQLNYQTCGDQGESPLMIAASKGHLKLCELLLKAGADPNADDLVGDTALHYAALSGQAETAKVLIDKGARTDRINCHMMTPLNLAEQNPAKFIGINTAEVCNVLKRRMDDVRKERRLSMSPQSIVMS